MPTKDSPKEIPLTHGAVALVDAPDYEALNQYKWNLHTYRKRTYARRSVMKANGKQGPLLMHRVIMGLTDPKIQVDHRDQNGLNNQRANLRIATGTQNQANIPKRGSCSSRFKGVHWDRANQKWRVRIAIHGKDIHLGRFTDEAAAARAYNKAAGEIFGEFAHLNQEVL